MDNRETDTDTMAREGFRDVPAGACCFAGGIVEAGDNGADAKTTPVRLVARSAGAIEHWYWGNVVHDMAGMHLHKSRVALDYVHDPGDIIGYLNHHEITARGLEMSGALTPWKDNDRASEIAYKSKNGVPYEASINFGGDGIRIQELGAGEFATVNGGEFEGPGVIIREWPLRGVAICPYGADANTESATFARDDKIRVAQWQPANTGDRDMADTTDITEETVEAVTEEATELAAVESVAAEVEADTETAAPDVRRAFVAELESLVTEVGAETACEVLLNGGGMEDARALMMKRLAEENEQLRAQIATRADTETTGEDPAEFSDGEPADPDPAATAEARETLITQYAMSHGLTPGQARFAMDAEEQRNAKASK